MKLEEDQVTLGRVDWSTCLRDIFGDPMENLLTFWAPHTGSCLGSAARLFRAVVTGESLPETVSCSGSFARTFSSYGRGFFLAARDLLPELSKNPTLLHTMERMLDQSPATAVNEYTATMNSLYAHPPRDPVTSSLALSTSSIASNVPTQQSTAAASSAPRPTV